MKVHLLRVEGYSACGTRTTSTTEDRGEVTCHRCAATWAAREVYDRTPLISNSRRVEMIRAGLL